MQRPQGHAKWPRWQESCSYSINSKVISELAMEQPKCIVCLFICSGWVLFISASYQYVRSCLVNLEGACCEFVLTGGLKWPRPCVWSSVRRVALELVSEHVYDKQLSALLLLPMRCSMSHQQQQAKCKTGMVRASGPSISHLTRRDCIRLWPISYVVCAPGGGLGSCE